MPDFKIEDQYWGKIVAGVDEAGRGPWAGPVVAGAVVLTKGLVPKGLDDSKKLSAKNRESIFVALVNDCDFGVGIVNESVIDQVNILEATKLAMKAAIFDLYRKPDVALIDGNQNIELVNIETQPVVKGDSLSLSISAASVIAKVTRDKIMEELGAEFPEYGWDTNAGYGTKQHMIALEKYGVTKYHRKSFAPIKKIMQK